MRYRAVVATSNEDVFGYQFSKKALGDLAANAVGKPVLLMFTQQVGEVAGAGCGEDGVSIVFESEKELAGFYCMPSYHNDELNCFGLVTAPADSKLTCVREVEDG